MVVLYYRAVNDWLKDKKKSRYSHCREIRDSKEAQRGFAERGNLVGRILEFLDTRLLANQSAQIEQTRTTHFAAFDYLNGGDVGVGESENTLDAHTVGDFADSERLGQAVALDLNHVAAVILLTRFVTFNNIVSDNDGIASFERRE